MKRSRSTSVSRKKRPTTVKKRSPYRPRYRIKSKRGVYQRALLARIKSNKLAMLSSCAQDYMEVLANPFDPKLIGAPCIPDYRAIPSVKFYLRVRGTFEPSGSGGTGLAFVALNPWRPYKSSAITDQNAAIHLTKKSGTAVTSIDVVTAQGTNTALHRYGFDTTFAASDWQSGEAANTSNKYRVVSAGLRIGYAGQWDSLKGTVALWRHPSNSQSYLGSINSNTGPTFDELLQFDETGYGALNHNQNMQVYYAPVDNDDFEYRYTNATSYPTMVAAISGGPTDAVYTYEAIVWYEASGPTLHGETPSHVDLKGLGWAMSGPKKQMLGGSPLKRKADMVSDFLSY